MKRFFFLEACLAFAILIAQQPAPVASQSAKPAVALAAGNKGDSLALAFSPDGLWLAALCCADRSVFVWSLVQESK